MHDVKIGPDSLLLTVLTATDGWILQRLQGSDAAGPGPQYTHFEFIIVDAL